MNNKNGTHNQKDTKHRILEIAADMFARDGYYKVSVREICSSAGVSKPVLYYYFNDKEALLEELVKETYYHIDELKKTIFRDTDSFETIIRNVPRLYIEFIASYPHLVRFSAMIQQTNIPENIRRMKLERYTLEMDEFIHILRLAQSKGLIDEKNNPKIISQNFFGTIIMIIAECIIFNDRQSELDSKLNEFIEFWIDNFLINNKE